MRLLPCFLLFSALHAMATPSVEQLTHGPAHHFYGYIGHVGNTSWSGDDRYMVLLRSSFQDHMPGAHEVADIVLVDTQSENALEKLDETRAWNFQQGTMLYWHPKSPDTQFFFNDRDPATNKIFTVLYDIAKRERVREYRFEDTPIANSGVARNGEYFFALNYARLAWLRPVTGYPETWDWTRGVMHPENDGIWKVYTDSGEKELLKSFKQLADAMRPSKPDIDHFPLFLNHTVPSRSSDWLYGYLRAGWDGDPRSDRIDAPYVLARTAASSSFRSNTSAATRNGPQATCSSAGKTACRCCSTRSGTRWRG